MPTRRSHRGKALARAVRERGLGEAELITGLPLQGRPTALDLAAAIPLVGLPARGVKRFKKADEILEQITRRFGRGPSREDVEKTLKALPPEEQADFLQKLRDIGYDI